MIYKRLMILLIITLIVPITSACSTLPMPSRSAADRDQLTGQIDQAEQRWQAQAITSYRIAGQQMAFGPGYTYELTVRNGRIIDQACRERVGRTNWCQTNFKPEQYTIPGLFAFARSQVFDTQRKTTITFDKVYGYPTRIFSDIPGAVDDELTVSVTAFEVLK
jgi:hypothetical protein